MQTYVERKNFSFVSKALSEDTFEVVKFSGAQAISRPYEFNVTLSANDPDINLKAVLRKPATLTIARGGEDVPIHGVVAAFEQLHEANQRVFYRAVLVPRLWFLGLYRENRLFINKTVPQILDEILKEAGLTSEDYELKLTRSYPAWEYVCQYAESNFDFISRWMEREGIYYFFKQPPNGEKLVITDSSSVHEKIPGWPTLSYTAAAGLIPEDEEIVTGFVCKQRVLPKKVILKDYNYRKPSLDVKAEADVDPNGREDVYIYGEHFKDPSQGKELAGVRAGEFLCRETMYYGEATSPRLAPGFLFELARHYRASCNRTFLVTEVEHQGIGTGLLLAGLGRGTADGDAQPGYSNRFVCIPSGIQFRPERKTPRPRINGMMNAVIDAAGDGSTAELDDQGRYKVILPFDLSGRKGGKASRWVRMAQPYSGSDYGMHFPLHKGSEVLLTFIDGDIDRPIISAAVPNPHTQSPVTNANQTKSVIRDKFGNEIIMDATAGDEHIRLHSPHHNSYVDLGRSWESYTDSDWKEINCGNRGEFGLGTKISAYAGTTVEAKGGLFNDLTLGLNNEVMLGGTQEFKWGYDWSYSRGPKRDIANEDINSISRENNIVSADKILCLIGGAKVEPSQDNTSIIRADEDSIELTVGSKQTAFAPGAGLKALGVLGLTELTAAVASVFAGVASAGKARGEKGETWGGAVPSVVLGAVSIGFALWLRKVLQDKANTPQVVRHDKPAAEIRLGKDGNLRLVSGGTQRGGRNLVIGITGETLEKQEQKRKELQAQKEQMAQDLDDKMSDEEAYKRNAEIMSVESDLKNLEPPEDAKTTLLDARITLLEDSIRVGCGPRGKNQYKSQIEITNDGSITITGEKEIRIQPSIGSSSFIKITEQEVRLSGSQLLTANKNLDVR